MYFFPPKIYYHVILCHFKYKTLYIYINVWYTFQ